MAGDDISQLLTQVCAKNKKWPIALEKDMIEMVRQNEFLWNVDSPLYSKKGMKRTGYHAVAKKLKKMHPNSHIHLNAETVQKKFVNLRTYYRKEYKDIAKMGDNGLVALPSRWIHFKRMSFLSEGPSERDFPSLSTNEGADSNAIVPYEQASSSSDDSEVELANAAVSSMRRKQLSARQNPDYQLCAIQSATKALEKISGESDGDQDYGQFVASQLKLIPGQRDRELARLEIQHVLIKYRFGEDQIC